MNGLSLRLRMFPLESCTGTSFCTRTRTDSFFLNRTPNRTGIAIPGPEYLYPDSDPTDNFRTRTEFFFIPGTRPVCRTLVPSWVVNCEGTLEPITVV